ncbi:uncharacterized protein LOC143218392 [Lasioglossum baleicum]|uniref:uncharacterized protein LOC143218392 n=1 Tax=Lasioglossum baleicum TaxID=434251 RepID=UPI003FCE12F0
MFIECLRWLSCVSCEASPEPVKVYGLSFKGTFSNNFEKVSEVSNCLIGNMYRTPNYDLCETSPATSEGNQFFFNIIAHRFNI